MALEEDIYEMYRDGPFDWFNPLDFMTSTLTGGPSGSWSEKTHSEKIFEITKQYPNLTKNDVELLVSSKQMPGYFLLYYIIFLYNLQVSKIILNPFSFFVRIRGVQPRLC